VLDNSGGSELRSGVEDSAREAAPAARLLLISVIGWLWVLGGAGMVIQAWLSLELRDWLISIATNPAGGGPLVEDAKLMPPFTLAAFIGVGILTIGAAIGLLRRRAWGRLVLFLVSLLALMTLVTVGVLLLVLDPRTGAMLLVAVGVFVLGSVAFIALLFILVAFLVSGALPPIWDLTTLGWATLGLSLIPAVSAFLLSTKTVRDAMLRPSKT
jgi:hypothetical protein